MMLGPRQMQHTHAPRQALPGRGRLQIQAAVRKHSAKSVVLSKTLTARKGEEKRVLRRCRDIVDFSQGKMRNAENGIESFECSSDRYEKNVFHFWERYTSNVAMGRHNNAPEMQAFMTDVQSSLEGPFGMALYEWKNGQIGHACVQGGPKGEGGLDDATGAGGAGGASMKQSPKINLGKVRRGDEGDSFGMKFEFPWLKKLADKVTGKRM